MAAHRNRTGGVLTDRERADHRLDVVTKHPTESGRPGSSDLPVVGERPSGRAPTPMRD
ncbi:hypothetical protein PJI17_17810 [Mycobacterium kansasii]|uniref:Uncharacterized protein n=1 Tax=Mycobacterium kansasii TaxID=1768 RepID=A0A1V3X5T0_MYCKA|nr:hypothetical protein BZL29_4553 [Mycobacterium kansasii]